MKRTRQTTKEVRGFTVIEAFVGISILLVGIVGPLTLVTSNMQGARFSRDQITAAYLAQEAIETVRQERDTNMIAGDPSNWLQDIDGCTSLDKCQVDGRVVESGTPLDAVGGSCSESDLQNVDPNFRLHVNEGTGEYGHDPAAGDQSRFWRCVWIEQPATDQAIIRALVIFDTGRYRQSYETVGYLTNWAQ